MTYGTQAFNPLTGHVVVVEDDPVLGGLLRDIVEEAGAECALYTTADDALVHLLTYSTPCALLVTDYLLPGQLNGIELATLVGQKWPTVPMILTTGYTLDHTPLPPRLFCLRKPWAIPQLMASIEQVMADQTALDVFSASSMQLVGTASPG
ncbi:response regulator [Pseudomonas sp. dw_358]|uniref:response regulator n=1 Tax=Pseudomonas sp. dw_358 TaxID=2720083 RepID=UPI001BD6A6EE|nr:response regulator [Pseudomonas sp. dw_358]